MKICYTAIIDDYDSLREPLFTDPDWIYICFTTNRNLKSNVWKFIYLEKEINPIKQARKIKILPSFDMKCLYYLWIDANIQIKSSLNLFTENLLQYPISLMSHPDRNNLFDEAVAIIRLKKDRADIINNQILEYQNQGYKCNELAATGILLRNKSLLTNNHAYIWMNEIIKHSHRDQMSFNYACYKIGIKPNYFPYDVIRDDKFIYHKHLKKVLI